MSYDVLRMALGGDIADAGTFVVGYPTGRGGGDYAGGRDHRVVSFAYGELSVDAGEISVSFGATEITITNNSGQVLAGNTALVVQLDRLGSGDDLVTPALMADPLSMQEFGSVVVVNLGAPDTNDPNGYVETQNLTALGVFSVDATAAAAIAAAALAGTADVPRNVVAAWTGTAVLTVTGTDEYGVVMSESSASGTSLTGKKAFKTVTGVSTSADITGLTVGTAKVLGLPAFLPGTGYVLRELQDGAAPTAGTLAAGVAGVATATTGDVRGTYAPNATVNGTLAFQLVCLFDDPADVGSTQA